MRQCSKCKKNKEINEFGKCSRNKDGFMYECKQCHNQHKSVYRKENPEISRKSNQRFYKNHKQKILTANKAWRQHNTDAYQKSKNKSNEKNKHKKCQYNKEYRRINKEQVNATSRAWYKKNKTYVIKYKSVYKKNRLKTDINFKLSVSLRDRLNKAIKNNQKAGSAVKDLGCSIEYFKLYLQKLFQPGMNWENHGFGKGKWHIDHKFPLSSFNLSDRKQFLKACHYTNLQPLWHLDNLVKGNRQ